MMFIRDIPVKVFSLFIALVLAYAVQRAGNASVVNLFVPLELKNLPEDRIVVKPVKRGAQIILKGPSFIIGPLASSPPPIRVRFPDGVGDRVSVSIKPTDISLPPSVEVLSIEPTQVDFVLEALDKQELPVAVPRIGQLAKELVLEGIDVSPSSILVKGPRSELKQLKVIETDPIDLGTLTSSAEVVLNVRSVGGSVTPQSKTVVARVAIGEQPTERKFTQIPVEVRIGGGVSGGFIVSPSTVALTISGSPSTLANLREQDLFPFVRTSGASNSMGHTREQVQIQLPLGLRVVSLDPAAVTVQQRAEQQRMQGSTSKPSIKKR